MRICRLLPIFILLLFSLVSQAQPQRGAVMLGGAIGGNYQKPGPSSTSFYFDYFWGGRIDPMAAYFVSGRLAVGAGLTFGLAFNGEDNITTFGGGPLARYYFNGSGKSRVFGQGALTLMSRKISAYNSHAAIGYAARLGADFWGNGRAAFECSLGYDYVRGGSDGVGIHVFGVNFGVSGLLGGGKN